MNSRTHARGSRSRELRIVAGHFRGRRWRFPETGLRPTPDRVRETLFNWLQGRVVGARALDLFAGSGALGLEALSRGAREVVFVEREPRAARALEALLVEWQAVGASVQRTSAERYLAGPVTAFDLAFLDPPYGSAALSATLERLAAGWLAPGAAVYLEHARREPMPAPPPGYRLRRSGAAGEVGYHLAIWMDLTSDRNGA